MITLESKAGPEVMPGAKAMELKMEIKGERPDQAMGMLLAGLAIVIDKFVTEHPDYCKQCPAYKHAKNLQWHIRSIEDETRTLLGTMK